MLVVLLFCSQWTWASGVANDSVQRQKHSFYVVPTLDYSKETDWALGVAGANYFSFTNIRRVSSLSYSANYSLNRQYAVSLYPKIYFNRCYLYANASFRRKSDLFCGIGNAPKTEVKPVSYLSDVFTLNVQPQYCFDNNWMVGGVLTMHYERMRGSEAMQKLQRQGVEGVSPFFVWSLGGVVSYDSRDNLFYPYRGWFFKTVLSYSEPALGSAVRMGRLQTDVRQYVTIRNEVVFAWQFTADMLVGSNVPFQLLPTFGGFDVMRGYRRGAWRDDVAMALQAELRVPLVWRLKAALFGSVGDVCNWRNWEFMPKAAYGVGLRLGFNKAKVNLRFDVARTSGGERSRFGDNWGFYFTASEAF